MGVKVTYDDIKGTCRAGSSLRLAQIIGALCKFIQTLLREEHMQHLLEAGNANAFISNPQPTKTRYDGVHTIHSQTLSACSLPRYCIPRSFSRT
jgi:hypothetical protein